MTMKHLYVPYELAIKLKTKGFDEPCFGWYSINTEHTLRMIHTVNYFRTNYHGIESCYLAPAYQQVTDWFREKHKIIIEIQLDQTSSVKWTYDIIKYNDFSDFERKTDILNWYLYKDYYEALTKAIEEALKLI